MIYSNESSVDWFVETALEKDYGRDCNLEDPRQYECTMACSVVARIDDAGDELEIIIDDLLGLCGRIEQELRVSEALPDLYIDLDYDEAQRTQAPCDKRGNGIFLVTATVLVGGLYYLEEAAEILWRGVNTSAVKHQSVVANRVQIKINNDWRVA